MNMKYTSSVITKKVLNDLYTTIARLGVPVISTYCRKIPSQPTPIDYNVQSPSIK